MFGEDLGANMMVEFNKVVAKAAKKDNFKFRGMEDPKTCNQITRILTSPKSKYLVQTHQIGKICEYLIKWFYFHSKEKRDYSWVTDGITKWFKNKGCLLELDTRGNT